MADRTPPPAEYKVTGLGEKAKKVLLDPNAQSADPAHPAFVARPQGAPVYHGFPLVEESRVDGWVLGVITDFDDLGGVTEGDAFVQAPDGSRAGLVWSVGDFEIHEILPPSPDRWGVYGIPFASPIRTVAELVVAFHSVLPTLRLIHAKVTGAE